jgi:hypothetical protein
VENGLGWPARQLFCVIDNYYDPSPLVWADSLNRQIKDASNRHDYLVIQFILKVQVELTGRKQVKSRKRQSRTSIGLANRPLIHS